MVWNLLLQADSGGPSPISDKAFTAHDLAAFREVLLAGVGELPECNHAMPFGPLLPLAVAILETRGVVASEKFATF